MEEKSPNTGSHAKLPEIAARSGKHQGTQIWFQEDTGKHYRIIEKAGDQKHCNQNGALVKPFDPNLTGKFNYSKRLQIMISQHPNEKEQVELPKSLRSNGHRNYSPRNNLLEGYTQMPRTFAEPYKNRELEVHRDISKRKRSIDTARFFKNASRIIETASMQGSQSFIHQAKIKRGSSNLPSINTGRDKTPFGGDN